MPWKSELGKLISETSLFTCVCFFGSQAIRMLRESWESVLTVTKDPSTGANIVRPTGADLLAQELFSVMNDQTPQVNNAPVTINQQGGAQGLTINSSGATADPPVLNVTSGNITLAGTGTVAIGTSSTANQAGSNVVLSGANLIIPPLGQIPLAATSYDPLDPNPLPTLNISKIGETNPGQAYLGMVSAHVSGNDYTMTLAGITGTVTATAGIIGGSYVVPNGSYFPVICTDDGSGGSSYNFQPYPYQRPTVTGALQDIGTGALPSLIGNLANLGLIVNSTTSSPQVVNGAIQSVAAGGGLFNLWIALQNIGFVSTSPYTNWAPQNVTGSRNDGGPTIPALTNLCIALQNLGFISNNTTP